MIAFGRWLLGLFEFLVGYFEWLILQLERPFLPWLERKIAEHEDRHRGCG